MDVDEGSLPSYFDPEFSSGRDKYRRYRNRKRSSLSNDSPVQGGSASRLADASYLYYGDSSHRPINTAILLEGIKQEVESPEFDGWEGASPLMLSSSKRRSSVDGLGTIEDDSGVESYRLIGSTLQIPCKLEDESLANAGETTFVLFESLLDSALQGLMPFSDLILRFEKACREVAESIKFETTGRYRIIEDKLLRRKSKLLFDEAASWSLLWYLFGKGTEEIPESLNLSPTTSHLAACQFVVDDHTAQLCLRIIQWLEGIASYTLDMEKKVRGWHVGSYLPSSGVWYHTQRFLKKEKTDPSIIQHLDFDAPTREVAQSLPDDKKQDESLLEDIWLLLKAGRLEEACDLCRSAGQPWRAATICPFGGMDHFPSVEALEKNGNNRTLQAIELESKTGHQWRLWRWASYCASEKIARQDGGKYEAAVYAASSSNIKRLLPVCMDWESACWAVTKSWLDIQVDLELASLEPGRLEQLKSYADAIDGSGKDEQNFQPSAGPDGWPYHVLDQQPRDILSLLQKLHSSDIVHEAVSRGCKEQHRQIEMNLMVGNIANLLDLIWSWVSPSDDESLSRPHGDPHMMRFGAHLVLILRSLHANEVEDAFRDKLLTVGDLILHIYVMYLFSKQHEELVGIYASQLSRHRCIDIFVHMMEVKLNSSVQVKYKLFHSAIKYLPFSPEDDDNKASFEDIIERVLARSREIKDSGYTERPSAVAEQHRSQSLQKAEVIQWLCFTPPSTLSNSKLISAKLLVRALMHSNVLLREFALISMWRVPKMPIGAHKLLSFLAEPLKQPADTLQSLEEYEISENLQEFEDWREYYSCDAIYRKWLKLELKNGEVSSLDLSVEEKENAITAARETLDASLSLLLRDGTPWLNAAESCLPESINPLYIELHATAMLCLTSGECMIPDATSCTALTSSLYSSVSEEVVLKRKLMVHVTVSSRDNYSVEVVLRCLAAEGDGLGLHVPNDGGLLATIMAAGFKGELTRFQAGITLEISRLDAWYSEDDGSLRGSAAFIVRGLCRQCCLPEIILRCMQISVSLSAYGSTLNNHDKLIELVAAPESGLSCLFSQHQLQEFLLFEREYSICSMEFQEEQLSMHDS